ncbi:MAG TPA: RNase adapter RapZ, partial [Solirubrobacterales bacterium]|nr:RNase adapter RapZ [Solirubrobacterales bacterium]
MITGYSGAGKSEAIAAFEDSGYFCVDNLPPRLIGALGELFTSGASSVRRAAVVTDVRGGEYFDDLLAVLEELRTGGLRPTVVFLEASEETLMNRFKETRRRHPLAPDGRILEGIRAERSILGPLRERADVVVDSTGLTGAMLRRKIATDLLGPGSSAKLALTVLTFGFKNGPPRDADLVFDVRFLPTPHYREDLRPLTGRDAAVVEYVEAGELASEYYRRLLPLLDFLLPAYVSEGKTHLTIAIGCTGGRHRSITVADRVARHIAAREDVSARVVHRDVELGERRPRIALYASSMAALWCSSVSPSVTRRRAAAPSASRVGAGWSAHQVTASAIASGSSGSISSPVPGTICSTIPSRRVPTTGSPLAIASSIEIGNGSARDGSTNASQVRSRS